MRHSSSRRGDSHTGLLVDLVDQVEEVAVHGGEEDQEGEEGAEEIGVHHVLHADDFRERAFSVKVLLALVPAHAGNERR